MGSDEHPTGGPAGGAPGGSGSVARVALIGLFVTALVTAQLTAAKILAVSLPFEVPIAGETLILPGAAVAYALTFFASDSYAELYGKRDAQVMVNVAFGMNFVLLGLLYLTLEAPAAPTAMQSVPVEQYRAVLWSGFPVVAGSLLAYVVSQNWDVIAFHRLREHTDGDALWLRNVGSTATSQLLDTVIFVSVAFAIAPLALGREAAGLDLVASLIVGQYLLKLAIAVVDTPFVYAVVRTARRYGGADAAAAPAN